MSICVWSVGTDVEVSVRFLFGLTIPAFVCDHRGTPRIHQSGWPVRTSRMPSRSANQCTATLQGVAERLLSRDCASCLKSAMDLSAFMVTSLFADSPQ